MGWFESPGTLDVSDQLLHVRIPIASTRNFLYKSQFYEVVYVGFIESNEALGVLSLTDDLVTCRNNRCWP